MARQPDDDTNRVSYPFGVLEIMHVQFMNKTLWFVHDDMYTSLQLLDYGVVVEDFFWLDYELALLLLVSLMLGLFLVTVEYIEQQ